jgi:hypothetical protein
MTVVVSDGTNRGLVVSQCAESDKAVNYCRTAGALIFAEVEVGRAQSCPLAKR